MRILSVYNSIFQLVPSKIDYIKKFFYFIFGSSLDLLSISLIPLIVSKVINTESRSISFINKYFDYDLKYLIIFLLGVFSDLNKITSPLVRIFFQTLLIIFFIIANDIFVSETRIDFLDNFIVNLNNQINIFSIVHQKFT